MGRFEGSYCHVLLGNSRPAIQQQLLKKGQLLSFQLTCSGRDEITASFDFKSNLYRQNIDVILSLNDLKLYGFIKSNKVTQWA